VIAEEHLPDRPAVNEDDRRTALARFDVPWYEQRVVNLEAVGSLRDDELRFDMDRG
jgi:hypothetical protein